MTTGSSSVPIYIDDDGFARSCGYNFTNYYNKSDIDTKINAINSTINSKISSIKTITPVFYLPSSPSNDAIYALAKTTMTSDRFDLGNLVSCGGIMQSRIGGETEETINLTEGTYAIYIVGAGGGGNGWGWT